MVQNTFPHGGPWGGVRGGGFGGKSSCTMEGLCVCKAVTSLFYSCWGVSEAFYCWNPPLDKPPATVLNLQCIYSQETQALPFKALREGAALLWKSWDLRSETQDLHSASAFNLFCSLTVLSLNSQQPHISSAFLGRHRVSWNSLLLRMSALSGSVAPLELHF